jgi:fructuronate reductase
MVRDVTPLEGMKLRMLNGTHSALAYVGYLAGFETVADAAANPVMAAYLRHLWRHEIIPTLTAPPGVDLHAYADALFARYANPNMHHRTWQIAMDGSQKLPQRILGTIAANINTRRPCPGLMLGVAAWMIYASGTGLDGAAIDVRDPMAAALCERATAPDPVAAVLGLRSVFPAALAVQIAPGVQAAYGALKSKGALGAVQGMA